jgi:hypothetical protein
VPLAIERTGPVWWGRGLNEALGDVGQEFLKKNFAETFERGGGEPSLYELETSPLNSRNIVGKAYKKVEAGGFVIQRAIDQLNAQATVLGIYMRKLAEQGKDPNSYDTLPVDKQALAEARVQSRRAVASPLYKDVPLALTKGSFEKLFFQFQNTFLDQWSNMRYDLPEYIRNNPKKAASLSVALVGMLLTETGVKVASKKAINSLTGQQQKEDDTFTKKLIHETLRRVPGLGQIMSMVDFGGSGIPAIDVAKEAIGATKSAITAEDRKSRNLAGVKAASAVAEMVGVPGASQISEVAQGKMKSEYFKTHETRVKEIQKEMFGKTEGLTFAQRRASEKKYADTKEPLNREESASAGQAAIRASDKRGKEIEGKLAKEELSFLERNKLNVPGHDDTVDVGKTRIVLSKEELQKMEEELLSNYKQRIGLLMKSTNFENLPQSTKKEIFGKQMEAAGRIARAKMISELSLK